MNCKNCGIENTDESLFCCHCGCPVSISADRQVDENYVDIKNPAENYATKSFVENGHHKIKLRKALFLVMAVILIIAGVFIFTGYSKSRTYNEALSLFESGDYSGAEERFSTIADYKDATTYLTECIYQVRY